MDSGRPAPPTDRRPARVLTLLAALAIGLVWLSGSVFEGLRSGRESDLHRRWVVSQYVRRGINPYPLALAALRRDYGSLAAGEAKPGVYFVPRLAADDPSAVESARSLLAAQGTPEATYPPSADLFLSVTLGMLPEGYVHLAGVVVNLALLVVCAILLGRLSRGASRERLFSACLLATAALLVWSPTQLTVYTGQFSILVTVCLLFAYRCLDRHEYLAGAWLALALVKPSLALPFLIFPLVRGRWRALAVAAGLHLAATGVQAVRFSCTPWDLLYQWTGVAAYFTRGQFTLEELLFVLRLADTPFGLTLVAGFVLFAAAWCRAYRAAGDGPLIDLLCFVCILWIYHGPYDFVILLIPLARRLTRRDSSSLPALVLFICVSLAASPLVYGDEVHLAARLVRHVARLLLAVGFVTLLVEVRRSARAAQVRRVTRLTSGEGGPVRAGAGWPILPLGA
jgi:hypothetical protein